MKIKNETSRPNQSQRFTIFPFAEMPDRSEINIYREKKYGSDKFSPAEISWPSIGSTPSEVAREFIAALNTALIIAAELDKDNFAKLNVKYPGAVGGW